MNCCNQACNQGRNCQTKQACELPLDDTPSAGTAVVLWVLGIFLAVGLVALIARGWS